MKILKKLMLANIEKKQREKITYTEMTMRKEAKRKDNLHRDDNREKKQSCK